MRSLLTFALLLPLFTAIADTPAYAQSSVSMFNGKDLSGWKGRSDIWTVKEGAITGTTSADNPLKENTFLVWTEANPKDFELTCQFKISAQGNSGIQYRSELIDEEKFVVKGYQADIDASLRYAGILYEEKGDGILCQRGEKSTVMSKKKIDKESVADGVELGKKIHSGQWNTYRIVAQGNHLKHYINDVLMSETIDNRGPEKAASQGIIALQVHVGPPMEIQFKDLELRNL